MTNPPTDPNNMLRGPNLRALGKFVEQRRLELGLRPGELGKRAHFMCHLNGEGTLVKALETGGRVTLSTIVRVLEALSIDDETALRIGGIDLGPMRATWEEWAAEPVPVVMSIRMMAAIWMDDSPPNPEDPAAVLAWAAEHRIGKHHLCCIRWSRRHCTYRRADGTTYDIHTTFPDGCPEPRMSLDLSSVLKDSKRGND